MWKSQLVTRRQWPKFRYETMPKSWILSLVMLSRPLHSCLLPTLLGYLSEIPKTSNLLWIQLLTRRVKTLKKISDQAAIRATRVEFFSKINKRPGSFIRDSRVTAQFWNNSYVISITVFNFFKINVEKAAICLNYVLWIHKIKMKFINIGFDWQNLMGTFRLLNFFYCFIFW